MTARLGDCPNCGGDIFACEGARYDADGRHAPCSADPEPITLTYMPRTGRRADWLGWFLLGLTVGIMTLWSALL